MPIAITLPGTGITGPGLLIGMTTDLTPFPANATWQITWSLSPGGVSPISVQTVRNAFNSQQVVPWTQQTVREFAGNQDVDQGQQIHVQVNLEANTGQVDTGERTATWEPTTGLGEQAFVIAQQPTTGGGLTDEQAQQLFQINQAIAPVLSLDGLTLSSLTGGAGVDFVAAQLPNAIFGVIVRLTQIPAELRTIEADDNYWRMTLAAVHIYRGTDLWLRFPIHTANRMCPLPQEGLVTDVAENELTAWLLQMSLQVTFAPGVLGEVLLMEYP